LRTSSAIYGFRDFCWLYVFAGVVSMAAFVGVDVLAGGEGAALGASGAIMGIAVVAAIYAPQKPIAIWGVLAVPLRSLSSCTSCWISWARLSSTT